MNVPGFKHPETFFRPESGLLIRPMKTGPPYGASTDAELLILTHIMPQVILEALRLNPEVPENQKWYILRVLPE